MDADQIRGLRPELGRYLRHFDDCFERAKTRAHLIVYVRGQLSDVPRKSVEPIALAEGVPSRTLQEFLSLLDWNEPLMLDRVQQLVAREHASSRSVGVIDETVAALRNLMVFFANGTRASSPAMIVLFARQPPCSPDLNSGNNAEELSEAAHQGAGAEPRRVDFPPRPKAARAPEWYC
jgi:hypothetical protein